MDIHDLLSRHGISAIQGQCWLWPHSVNHHGYGRTTYNGKEVRTHRLAYQLSKGPIPQGLHVCHSCDTPACINPDHLFLGTALANMHDMIRKGRKIVRRGDSRADTKITDSQVIAIRNDPRDNAIIGREYKVHPSHIAAIKGGYKRQNGKPYVATRPRTRLTAKEVLAIRADTRLHRIIAAEYDISEGYVWNIQNRVRRRNV